MIAKEDAKDALQTRKEYLEGDNIQDCEVEHVKGQINALEYVLHGEIEA